MPRIRERRYGLTVLVVLTALAVLAVCSSSALAYGSTDYVTVNWSAAAAFYDAPCAETTTFAMSATDYATLEADLTAQVANNYAALLAESNAAQQAALTSSQTDWQAYFDAQQAALAQTWDQNIKVWYGTELECRTNIYRDISLALLSDRAWDLACWRQGLFVCLDPAALADKQTQLDADREDLQVAMGLCLYVTTEDYRALITQAHRAWDAFYLSNAAYVAAVCGKTSPCVVGESLYQTQRTAKVTTLFYQGCRFFHREREE